MFVPGRSVVRRRLNIIAAVDAPLYDPAMTVVAPCAPVMPTEVGIHAFARFNPRQAWMLTFVSMTREAGVARIMAATFGISQRSAYGAGA